MTTPRKETIPEEQLLLPRHPAAYEEDWPEFMLSDVEVLNPGQPSQYANLFQASERSPVQVTGRLELLQEYQKSLVCDPNYPNKRILIDNVTWHSYKRNDDYSNIKLRIAGRAGWYLITHYRPVYAQNVQEVNLMLFLVHYYGTRQHQKDGNTISVTDLAFRELCEKYAEHTNGICSNADDAADLIYKHRQFLLERMEREEGGVEWKRTAVFNHLQFMVRDEEESRWKPPHPRKSLLRPRSSGKRPTKTRRKTVETATATSTNPSLPSLSEDEESSDADREWTSERKRRTPPLSSSSDEEPDEEEQWPSSGRQTLPADILRDRDRHDDTQMRVDLVVEEHQRSRGRGVNHLLDRILEKNSLAPSLGS